ncbi:MAG: hypothetical protein ACXVZU_00190, partial [Methanobacteriaceae archaeon]
INFCPECGKDQGETKVKTKVVERVVVEKTPEKEPVGVIWFIIGILIPLIDNCWSGFCYPR